VNRDAIAADGATADTPGEDPAAGYPPVDNFYHDAQAPERRYIWRWVCYLAPDLVLEIKAGDAVRWEANDAVSFMPVSVGAGSLAEPDSLLSALGKGCQGLGPIPGLRLTTPPSQLPAELERLWQAIRPVRVWPTNPARRELEGRRSRPVLEVAGILASAYGHKLETVVYTQGVAISGRLRLARLDPAASEHSAAAVTPVVEPFLSGARDPFGDRPGGSTLGGLLWAYDLARHDGDARASDLFLRAAGWVQPRGPGEAPAPADPDYRVEDMFNLSAILGRAYRLSNNPRYLDLMKDFLLNSGVQQENGLFWHCRSAPYFWGRGNGFAALGFAEALTYLPEDDPQRDALLEMHGKHLEALRRLQQPSGLWCQMLDVPGSYQEFTCTCMIGYAVARGLRRGWLDASYRDAVEQAWQGVSQRIDDQGNVVDACISTGVQQSVKDYLDRTAVSGLDERSGAMALWFAVEMDRLRQTLP
jgi:unsaturated rhamnogalacturonyl hydrolase